MKLVEALRILKQNKEIEEMLGVETKQTETLGIAIRACEKQIEKKPIEASEFTNDYVFEASICPLCEERVFTHYSHCPDCGQKLDWGKE